jgi:hypothetical protein
VHLRLVGQALAGHCFADQKAMLYVPSAPPRPIFEFMFSSMPCAAIYSSDDWGLIQLSASLGANIKPKRCLSCHSSSCRHTSFYRQTCEQFDAPQRCGSSDSDDDNPQSQLHDGNKEDDHVDDEDASDNEESPIDVAHINCVAWRQDQTVADETDFSSASRQLMQFVLTTELVRRCLEWSSLSFVSRQMHVKSSHFMSHKCTHTGEKRSRASAQLNRSGTQLFEADVFTECAICSSARCCKQCGNR